MSGKQIHRAGTVLLSALMVLIGVALIVQVATGSSGGVVRSLLGALFLAGGLGRLHIERKRGRKA